MKEEMLLTQRQIDLVRASVPKVSKQNQFNFYLLHVLIAMPLYFGMSRDEMCELKLSDVDFSDTHLRFNGRAVPWHPETKRLFRRYVSYRASRIPPDVDYDGFLVVPSGRLTPGNHEWYLTYHRMMHLYKMVSEASRVRVTLQRFRHTYGYHLALAGAPVHVIMGALNCQYSTAIKCIKMASRTVEVDEWYQEAIAPTVRPMKELR